MAAASFSKCTYTEGANGYVRKAKRDADAQDIAKMNKNAQQQSVAMAGWGRLDWADYRGRRGY